MNKLSATPVVAFRASCQLCGRSRRMASRIGDVSGCSMERCVIRSTYYNYVVHAFRIAYMHLRHFACCVHIFGHSRLMSGSLFARAIGCSRIGSARKPRVVPTNIRFLILAEAEAEGS